MLKNYEEIREQENRNYDKNKAKLVRLLWDINKLYLNKI